MYFYNFTFQRVLLYILSPFFILGLLTPLIGETVILETAKDNTIFSENNNSNGRGFLFSGNTQGRTIDGTVFGSRRALIQFDLPGSVPSGAIIKNASLSVFYDRRGPISEGMEIDIFLHRLIQDWGETGNSEVELGMGELPQPGDATWHFSFFDTKNWFVPGGNYEKTPSATQIVTEVAPAVLTWNSPTLVSDVQGWVDDPEQNFGWIFIVDESVFGGVIRFLSRLPRASMSAEKSRKVSAWFNPISCSSAIKSATEPSASCGPPASPAMPLIEPPWESTRTTEKSSNPAPAKNRLRGLTE